MRLEDFGWDSFFAEAFGEHSAVGRAGRVSVVHRGVFMVHTTDGEIEAELSGKFRHSARDWPVTGDWVVLGEGTNRLEAVLPRKTKFSRKQPGARTEEQVLASNIDAVFLVTGLDGDFNLRRLERYLLLAWESGARPVVVLNKADLCPDRSAVVEQVRPIAAGAPVVLMSALAADGPAELAEHFAPGETAALLGSSGVGKSTIVNRWLGFEAQRVKDVIEATGRGRHTTTHRELIRLPDGRLLMDLPGLRELQLWADGEGLEQAFADIASLAARCRFRDCRHQGEPGCAVAQALEQDELDEGRFRGYAKMRRELDYLERQTDQRAAAEEKLRVKRLHKMVRRLPNRW